MVDIGVTVLGVLRRDDAYLVQRLTDPAGEAFYRPIGGGMAFGEPSADALEREFREELGVEVVAGPPVGTIENRFTWDGEPDHEVVILREAAFVDGSLYERDRFHGIDAGGAVEYEATWRSLEELVAGPEPFYPEGIARLLDGNGGEGNGHVDVR